MGLGISAVLTFGVASGIQLIAGLSAFYAVKATILFPLLGILVAKHRRAAIGPADVVTLQRGLITALVLGFIGESGAPPYARLLWLGAGLAFLLDAVDGWLARRTQTSSAFGADLDMELDGLTVIGLGALLISLDRTGLWALAPGLFRYVWIGATLFLPWMRRPLFPTSRRAWMCGVQLTLVIFALLPWEQTWASPVLAGVGLLALAASFAIDAAWLFRNR